MGSEMCIRDRAILMARDPIARMLLKTPDDIRMLEHLEAELRKREPHGSRLEEKATEEPQESAADAADAAKEAAADVNPEDTGAVLSEEKATEEPEQEAEAPLPFQVDYEDESPQEEQEETYEDAEAETPHEESAEAPETAEEMHEVWSATRLIGWAAALLQRFSTLRKCLNCLDTDMPDKDKLIVKQVANALFWEVPEANPVRGRSQRQKVLQSTSPTSPRPAIRLKTAASIQAALEELMEWRRTEQQDDTSPMNDPEKASKIWNAWCNHWLAHNLTAEQERYLRMNHTSIFTAYMHRRYGSKHFVFAILQTGITWAPSTELVDLSLIHI